MPSQAWCVRALDAKRAALGPAHPDTIRTLNWYTGCQGARVGWQQAVKTLQDYSAQLKTAGLGDSEGEPVLLVSFDMVVLSQVSIRSCMRLLRILQAALHATP